MNITCTDFKSPKGQEHYVRLLIMAVMSCYGKLLSRLWVIFGINREMKGESDLWDSFWMGLGGRDQALEFLEGRDQGSQISWLVTVYNIFFLSLCANSALSSVWFCLF